MRAIPHHREFLADTLTPLAVYRRLCDHSKVRFLLESVTGGEQVSRYSFMGAEPRATYRLFHDRLEEQRQERARVLPGPPLDALRTVLDSIRSERREIPFEGGYVGFFGYDTIRMIEKLPSPESSDRPIAVFARFDAFVVFDHARQRVVAVANEIEGEVSATQANEDLDRLTEILTSSEPTRAVPTPTSASPDDLSISTAFGGDAFRSAVAEAKELIRAGDIFQVVLARRWEVADAPDPLALYRALRMVNPSPYMVLLELPEISLIGASPEMLVRKSGSRIENRPIAGTRKRGIDSCQDGELADEMTSDAKERAEHVMLVDLGRNDIGKVGKAGTVEVASFMEVERYSHVMHMVSSVRAEIEDGVSGLDALLACFPAGTVSGAPKIRAMEIIDRLEPEPRGAYAGASGYFSFSGDLDTCITIRTLVVEQGITSVTAGAGIVADSDPAAEESETENKAAGLLAAVRMAKQLDRFERDGDE